MSAASENTVMILGGAGLVGTQVTRKIASDLAPGKIVVASLFQKEARELIGELRREFRGIRFVELVGNLFVRNEFAREDRADIIASPARRRALYEDLFGRLDDAYERSTLVAALREHK